MPVRFEVLTALLLKIQVFYDTTLWITVPSSLWSSIPSRAASTTLLRILDSEHEGTTIFSNNLQV
jgi:hypothetical protein